MEGVSEFTEQVSGVSWAFLVEHMICCATTSDFPMDILKGLSSLSQRGIRCRCSSLLRSPRAPHLETHIQSHFPSENKETPAKFYLPDQVPLRLKLISQERSRSLGGIRELVSHSRWSWNPVDIVYTSGTLYHSMPRIREIASQSHLRSLPSHSRKEKKIQQHNLYRISNFSN